MQPIPAVVTSAFIVAVFMNVVAPILERLPKWKTIPAREKPVWIVVLCIAIGYGLLAYNCRSDAGISAECLRAGWVPVLEAGIVAAAGVVGATVGWAMWVEPAKKPLPKHPADTK